MGSNTLNQFNSGLSSELFVASFFAERGLEVLWPLQTQSRYDLVIHLDGEFKKLQVKTASWSDNGKYKYLQARISGKNKRTNTPYKEGDLDFFVFTDRKQIWLASFRELENATSVCLASNNPNYKPQTKYNAEGWLVK